MYLPRVFEGSPELARELLHAYPFATVVARAAEGAASDEDDAIEILHVPLLVEDAGPTLAITGHVARANPFARLVAAEARVTAAFHGPDAYVSASFYDAPHEEVPTWNYAVVHVRGRLRPLDDAALATQLGALAARFERGEAPWHPDLIDAAFFAELRQGIVGFAIDVVDVRAKLKLSQNRSPRDRDRVEAALHASVDPRERAVAALMRRITSLREPAR